MTATSEAATSLMIAHQSRTWARSPYEEDKEGTDQILCRISVQDTGGQGRVRT